MEFDNLATLMKSFTASSAKDLEQPETPPRPFSGAEVAVATKEMESKTLRSFLAAPVFASGPEVYVEDLGCFAFCAPDELLAANENLAKARQKYSQFSDVPQCFVLSLDGSGFIALRADDQVITIDGNDGEVLETGMNLEKLLAVVEAGLEQELANR